MTSTSRSADFADDWAAEASIEEYQYTVLGRQGLREERTAWLEEHGINDFKQMFFSDKKHYYIFKNSEDALKFKIVWG